MNFVAPSLRDQAQYLHLPKVLPQQLEAVAVVPARNEAQRIIACLEALRCQWSRNYGSMHHRLGAVLVINGTTDGTAYAVMQWVSLHPSFCLLVIDVDFPAERAHVGSARRLGLDVAASLLAQRPAARQLLFSTDADSRLAHNAVCEGLRELKNVDAFGAHIVAGEPDTSRIGLHMQRYQELKGQLRYQVFPSAHERHAQHGVFGGAGFGVSLTAYRAVGGLPALSFDEDQMMRRRLLDAGYRVSYPRDIVVYTSTRLEGRTPWGMAKQLAAWEQDAAVERWPHEPDARALAWKYTQKAKLREDWAMSNSAEAFEQVWQRYWQSDETLAFRQNQFRPRALPEAIASLTSYLKAQAPVLKEVRS